MSESPRKPELKEILDLQSYLFETHGSKRAIESINELEQLSIAVFDNYATDNGAEEWSGKMMIVVWSKSPSDYQAFTWNSSGKIKPISQSKEIENLLTSQSEIL